MKIHINIFSKKCLICKKDINLKDKPTYLILSWFKGLHYACLGEETWRWFIKNKANDLTREYFNLKG